MLSRSLVVGVAVVSATMVGAACTDDPDDGAAAVSTSAGTVTTPTTDPPIILGLGPNLELLPDQCWASLAEDQPAATEPDATTTTGVPTTTTTVEAGETATTDEEQPPERITTIPRPAFVAVVDCSGSNDGQAFASFCLGAVEGPNGTDLGRSSCGLPADLGWPGDRAVRRAAARECLVLFEETYGEAYAASPLVAREFTPTEGVWSSGDRRVVCTIDASDP